MLGGATLPYEVHVRYADQKAIVAIETLGVLRGRLSPKALALVTEWAVQHQEELRADWELARRHAPLRSIPPLE
ncbi:MAG: DUF4160 domain-containing protein [Deltaproteobacteria bacterium]|nr:DUF4160 domain-containing protein [Deltaproteobacteria bacterium]